SLQKLSDYATLELAQAASPGCQYIRHTYYALCYDEMHEQPRWTVYVLKAEQLRRGRLRRSQDFRPDPNVKTISAQLEDYRKSGYDRGHLVPAADFKWDSVGMSETFYLSNMSPQLHAFNAGIWERVESTVRAWALQKKQLVIYTGPILDTVRQRIGKNRVSVPRAYYKVVYHLDEKEPSAVAFLVPHAPSERLPTAFLVTVDSVEKVTGIDFFPALPDQIEERIEGRLDKQRWRERAAPR
ncbi:MAG: DNA/RNA non-specific endonuclease, partial [Bacteroidia bacterium]|nr:DNA/RNA non-specific endonuclease [Bacteroidia bacterium]MDW8015218.1 DNA/RNA non-specific endonuclease [Bacteroidia bacterium]